MGVCGARGHDDTLWFGDNFSNSTANNDKGRGWAEMGSPQGAPEAGSCCFLPLSHMFLISRIRSCSGSSFIRHSLSSA